MHPRELRSPHRRRFPVRAGLLVLAVLTGAAVLLGAAGCGVPPAQNSTPPAPESPKYGVNLDAPDHSVALRNLFIADPATSTGYPAGASVPVSVQLWNNTNSTVSLTKASAAGQPVLVVLPGSAPAATDAALTVAIPGGTSVDLSQATGQFLLIRCSPVALRGGMSVPMTFTFSNGVTLSTAVPVGLVVSVAATTPAATGQSCG